MPKRPQFIPTEDASKMAWVEVTPSMMAKMDLFYRAHQEAFGFKEKK